MALATKNIIRFRHEFARLVLSLGPDNHYYGYPEVKACIITLRYNLLYEHFDQDPLETLLQIKQEPYREFKFENPGHRVNIRQVTWTRLPWQLIKGLFDNIQAEINKIKEVEARKSVC